MRTEMIELLPRYSFLTPLVRGARVLELGAVDRTFGETSVLLHDRGAASVVALGSSAAVERAKREHGGPGLVFRNATLAQLQPASFDLAFVHDASAVLGEGAVRAIARLLVPGGNLVVAVPAGGTSLLPHSGASRYAEVLAALRPIFPSIEVATQQALVGWVVTPSAAERPALVVDDSFGGAETPAFHLFVCGTTATTLRDQTLVQLEALPVLGTWGERGAGEVLHRERARSEELVRELRHARERIAERESWIEGLRHEIETRHATSEEQAAELHVARTKLVRLEREHGETTEALRRVREQLVVRARELDGARQAIDVRTQDLRIAEEELENVRGAAQAIGRERAALEERCAALQAELDALRAEPAPEGAGAGDLARALDEARAELGLRTEACAQLQAEADAARARIGEVEEELRAAARSLADAEEACERRVAEATAALQAQVTSLQAALADAPISGLEAMQRERAQAVAELEELRRAGVAGLQRDASPADDVSRRLRELEEAADSAQRRAREAEERMRAAEKRADAADSARAESVATARRWQLEAETARREAAGVAAGMADRESLRTERDEALARAAEEAGRRAAARNQLQREVERAQAAEQALAILREELETLRKAGALAIAMRSPNEPR